ncbi:MAG TPA: hypothetical protein VEY92_10825 [Pseudoxanthomonas sp.]|nr:hypothetical protein [Pseudoxanthomonas sp.]
MFSTPQGATAAPIELSGFLRRVERRAALFGQFQCGNQALADRALAAAMRAFRDHAAELPVADWPRRFWTLLADAPPLRRSAQAASWPDGLQALETVAPRPRQALLLRLVAGLPEDTAADVLGMAPEMYREALAAACPRDAQGRPDPQAWRRVADVLQEQLRELPPERLAALARPRETALGGVRPPEPVMFQATVTSAELQEESKRRWPWALLVVVLCALALAATWWWPRGGADLSAVGAGAAGDPRIEVEALSEQPPAARFDAGTALSTHPDLALVRDPEEATLAAQADFLAWYAANRGGPEKPQEQAARIARKSLEANDAAF